MRLENIVAAFFVIVVLLTLVSIEPYHTGHFMMPSSISLEAAIFIILVSLFIVLVILIPKKRYRTFL
jgi:hypothetical protein